jgi:hypothetical protein
MKLVRSTSASSFAAMSLAALLFCGCSATASQPPRTASLSNVAGTTSLMSAEISGPAPRVGKSHLAVDEADSDVDVDAATSSDDSAPKEARRSDGSRRSGGFGTSAK